MELALARSPSPHSVRIIAGDWRGRKVPVLDKPGLRPTTDRVRETLFNWLAPHLSGARCLDLFAGTGALGLECLSRGASFVQFVEKDTQVAKTLINNLNMLGGEPRSAVYGGSAQSFIASFVKQCAPFDVVFVDPPFADIGALNVLALMQDAQMLAGEGFVYVEQGRSQPQPELPNDWRLHREKTAGQVRFQLFKS